MKGSKTIPETLSGVPAALVTVADELLSLRRGAGERRGPTMPATTVTVLGREEEAKEAVRLNIFFFF